ncbi:MAG TPA: 5-formyltetrahydrofolate cyclo-ligase [Campylobacterales bacterium]|nr:5-formyltetrahydrofolate cyclo-ligase [Campylobacterales bacterium]HHC11041.1 5-formyltetrahydrofolate cyclo-ligase [Campylobacterales bacterium]HHD81438.1 5-formyltetrahydrofolate cyclo-ligase [Campylobacterales bacterium]
MNKSKFRKECIDKLKQGNQVINYRLDKIVSKILYKYIKKQNCKVVMFYIPLKIEININSLIIRLRREGITLLVPFMEGKSFRLVKYRLPIKIKNFGVKEPNISNLIYKKIDLAIVPIIGMDRSFRRVGFGKGFYDRFFEENGNRVNRVLFVSRKQCISKNIITDDYDVKGNVYITPKNILNNKNRYI